MKKIRRVDVEAFALRHGERCTIMADEPTEGRWFAVMAQPTFFPDGESHPVRVSDNMPVEMFAILACQKCDGKWQWMQLAPQTKEDIGDMLFDSNAPKGQWWFVAVTQSPSQPTGLAVVVP